MRYISSTYRFLAALVSFSVLLSTALPVASQTYAMAGGQAPIQHVASDVDACDGRTMSHDMQCGCCMIEVPMPKLPEALLQSNTLKGLASLSPVALVGIAPLSKDAGADRLASSGVYISRSLRLHVLHATFLN